PTLLLTGPAAKAQAVLVSGAASDTCQTSGAHFAELSAKRDPGFSRAHSRPPRNLSHFKTLQNRHHLWPAHRVMDNLSFWNFDSFRDRSSRLGNSARVDYRHPRWSCRQAGPNQGQTSQTWKI